MRRDLVNSVRCVSFSSSLGARTMCGAVCHVPSALTLTLPFTEDRLHEIETCLVLCLFELFSLKLSSFYKAILERLCLT